MRNRDLGALVVPVFAAAVLFVPAFAQSSRDPMAAALESFKEFDAALAALKPPAYQRLDRTRVAERLADLKRKVDAVKLADAQRTSSAAAALDRVSRAVADAEERERIFWRSQRSADGEFPDKTAETLRRDDAAIRSAWEALASGSLGGHRAAGFLKTASVPPPAASRSVTLALKGAGRSISDPNSFFDGASMGSGGVAANRAGGVNASAAAKGGAVPARAALSDLRVARVPNLVAASRPAKPAVSPDLEACRKASGGGLAARLCSSPFPMIAPAVAGFGDALKEQFGTAAGWASTAASLLVGIVLPAVMGGVGILFNVLRAVCGLAVLWAIGALVKSLYALSREFASTSPTDPRHWLAARRFGSVCGKLLLTIVFTIAGIKIGSQPGVKGAVMSGLQSLQAKLATLGGGAAAPSALAAQIRGAFGVPEAAAPKPAEPAIKPPRPPERTAAGERGSRVFRQMTELEKKVAVERRAEFDQSQLQSKFKHAEDFGVEGNANRGTIQAYRAALESHLRSAKEVVAGTYRGQPVLHFLDPATRLDVMIKPDGEFLSGWRLNPDQATNIRTRGSL